MIVLKPAALAAAPFVESDIGASPPVATPDFVPDPLWDIAPADRAGGTGPGFSVQQELQRLVEYVLAFSRGELMPEHLTRPIQFLKEIFSAVKRDLSGGTHKIYTTEGRNSFGLAGIPIKGYP